MNEPRPLQADRIEALLTEIRDLLTELVAPVRAETSQLRRFADHLSRSDDEGKLP